MTQQRSRDAAAGPSHPAGTDELRAEIEQTRRSLGDTVEALAAKTDVKARARETADRMKTDMSARARRMTRRARTGTGAGATGTTGRPAATGGTGRGVGAVAMGAAGVAVAVMVLRRGQARRSPSWQRMMPARGRQGLATRARTAALPTKTGRTRMGALSEMLRRVQTGTRARKGGAFGMGARRGGAFGMGARKGGAFGMGGRKGGMRAMKRSRTRGRARTGGGLQAIARARMGDLSGMRDRPWFSGEGSTRRFPTGSGRGTGMAARMRRNRRVRAVLGGKAARGRGGRWR